MTPRPPSADEQQWLNQAVAFHQAGNLDMARRVYRQVLQAQPNNAEVLRLLGTAEAQAGQLETAAGLLTQSLALVPDQARVRHTLAIVLEDLGRLNEAVALYDQAAALQPGFRDAPFNCGGALLALGRPEEALVRFDRVLALEPRYAEAHSNRGNALAQLQRGDEALAAYDRAIALQPGYADAYANRGIALAGLGRVREARDSYALALARQPDLHAIRAELAHLYELSGDLKPALDQWTELARRLQGSQTDVAQLSLALNRMTQILTGELYDDRAGELRDDVAADAAIRQSLAINPSQPEAAQDFINLRQRQCAWPIIAPFGAVTRQHLLAGLSPFSASTLTDDPLFQLAVNARRNPAIHSAALSPQAAETERLRIGYLSSDLRVHPIGFLMSEVPGLHDRSRVEVFLYYSGPKADDPVHAHYRAEADHFVDLSGLNDAAAAKQIADDGIHILVDINGHTGLNRKRVLARRPAPVIVNWLGFPGTMGGPHHHYIIADDWIIPPENEPFYSERVMRLACYQPNNRHRVVSDVRPTRAEAGLAEDAFVLCCFNGTRKITRHTFERWMAILQRAPNAVLWLLGGPEPAHVNLRRHAQAMGVDPARLIFADALPNAEHLARYPLADLFVDTAPYGAHTTCSDALWMGVPVITFSGRSFASRVCGSLLRSAGLPELVCTRADDFVELAVALAEDPARLEGYRQRLKAGRDSCALFDTPALVRRLESLYARMWEEALAGQLPTPDLRNLDAYLKVGMMHDHEAVEMQTVEDYDGFWRDRLARLDEAE